MTLLMTTGSLTIAAGAVIFLVITLILVGALLAAKAKLVPSGNVDLKVNGEKDIETPIGSTLLAGCKVVVSSCLLLVVVVVNVASAVHKYWKEAGKSCRQKRAFSLVNRLRNTGVWHVSAK